MGHYWSEMRPDSKKEPYRAPRTKDIPYEDRPRHTHTSPWFAPQTEEGTVVEFALDYDSWDGEFRGRDDTREDHYIKSRQLSVVTERMTEEKLIEHYKRFASIHHDGHEERPAVMMRRTVTYGPWEVVTETTEHTEGWH